MADSNELLTTLTSLGFDNAGNYQADIDVINSIRVLIKCLMRDSKNFEVRLQIGTSNIWEKDLIPLLVEYNEDNELFLVVVRLMLNLSMPVRKIFKEQFGAQDLSDVLKEDPDLKHNYESCHSQIIRYKKSFVDLAVWTILKEKLALLLSKPWEDRDIDDSHSVERILYLARNILHIPSSKDDRNRASGEDTTHDKISRAFVESGFGKVAIYIASNDDCFNYRGHMVEIVAQILREQEPRSLAQARTSKEKEEELKQLVADSEQEKMANKVKWQTMTSRHSRFGGTFSVINSGQERGIVTRKLVRSVAEVSIDRVKIRHKMPTRKCKGQDVAKSRISSAGVRVALQNFCDSFLTYGYNNAMNGMRNYLQRTDLSTEDNDEVYYFHIMHIFMTYTMARPIWSTREKVAYISETMSQETIMFVERTIFRYQENIVCDKTRQSEWTNKLNYALLAFKTIIQTILVMAKSNDEQLKFSADQLKEQILYAPEYREIIPGLFKAFNPVYQTKNYLRDLMLTQHTLLKLLDGTKEIIVQGKSRKPNAKQKTTKKKKEKVGPLRDEILRDGAWNDIQEDLEACIAVEHDLDNIMKLNIINPMDEEIVALGHIQLALHGRKRVKDVTPGQLGLKLLRACQQLWPEDEKFGNRENEREILQTLCKEKLPDESFPDEEEESEDDQMEEEDGKHYEEITEAMIAVEDIISLYATPEVISKAGLLLNEYEFNPPEVNRAVCKLLHRIAYQLKKPAMCYQASIFLALQRINNQKALVKSNPVIQEIWTFGKHLLGLFFKTYKINKKLPLELLFWTKHGDCTRIQEGSYENRFQKRSALWDEDRDEELRMLVREAEHLQERKQEEFNLVDYVSEQYTDDSKTTAQIKRRLIKLGLLQKSNVLGRTPEAIWSEEMENKLLDLFVKFNGKVQNIIAFLQDQGVEYSRKAIVDKLLRTGSISSRDDVKTINKRELQPMEMAEPIVQMPQTNRYNYDNVIIEDVGIILRRLKFTPATEATLKWIQEELDDEIRDRIVSPEDEWVDRSLVSSEMRISVKIETEPFIKLLKSARFEPPNYGHIYWRIGIDNTMNELEYFSSQLAEFEPDEQMVRDHSEDEDVPNGIQQTAESDEELEAMLMTVKSTKSPQKSPRKKMISKPNKSPRKKTISNPKKSFQIENVPSNSSIEEYLAHGSNDVPPIPTDSDTGSDNSIESNAEGLKVSEPQPGVKQFATKDPDSDDSEDAVVKKRRRVIIDSDSD